MPLSLQFPHCRSTSLPQLDQVSGDDTQAPAGASGLERRVATLQQEVRGGGGEGEGGGEGGGGGGGGGGLAAVNAMIV